MEKQGLDRIKSTQPLKGEETAQEDRDAFDEAEEQLVMVAGETGRRREAR